MSIGKQAVQHGRVGENDVDMASYAWMGRRKPTPKPGPKNTISIAGTDGMMKE